jgi:hypothetical protein
MHCVDSGTFIANGDEKINDRTEKENGRVTRDSGALQCGTNFFLAFLPPAMPNSFAMGIDD